MLSPIQLRREEEKELRRQEILDAAEEIIAQSNWQETNFGEIAKRTRLSRSLIYVYFPTRDALFNAVCNRGAAVLKRIFIEAMAGEKSGLEQVEAIGRAYYRFSQEYPMYFKLHAEQQAREDVPAPGEGPGFTHPALELLSQALVRGLKDGSINPQIGDLKLSAISLWTFTHGLLLIAARKRKILGQMEIGQDRLVDHGFEMLHLMLASPQGCLPLANAADVLAHAVR